MSPQARLVAAACLALMLALTLAASTALAAGGGDEPAPPAGPQFLMLAPMSGPVFRDGRVWGAIALAINLEVKDGAYLADVERGLPRIEADALNFLVKYANSGGGGNKLINLDLILARIQKIVDRHAGKGHARVLVHSVTQLRKR